MKDFPALMAEKYTLEERKGAAPEIQAKIKASLEAAADKLLKRLQAGQVPLFERLMKEGGADAPLQSEPPFKQGDTVEHQYQAFEDKILPSPLAEQIEMSQPPNSDDLFIGGDGNFMQWSVSHKKVTKDYGTIMAGYINSMVQTSDKKFPFCRIIGGVRNR
jgi:hypothetical protein